MLTFGVCAALTPAEPELVAELLDVETPCAKPELVADGLDIVPSAALVAERLEALASSKDLDVVAEH